MPFTFAGDVSQCGFQSEATPERPIVDQSVEGVAEPDDPGRQRYSFAQKTLGVPVTAPPFVVILGDLFGKPCIR